MSSELPDALGRSMSNARAAYALFWAISIEPSDAPPMRSNATPRDDVVLDL